MPEAVGYKSCSFDRETLEAAGVVQAADRRAKMGYDCRCSIRASIGMCAHHGALIPSSHLNYS